MGGKYHQFTLDEVTMQDFLYLVILLIVFVLFKWYRDKRRF